MKMLIAGMALALTLVGVSESADAHPGHDRYDRKDRVERRIDRRIERADRRAWRRAERRAERHYRKRIRQYRRVNERHYRRHYRGHRHGVAPRFYRQHAFSHPCDLRYRHFHGRQAYFGSLEAVLLGEVAREVVYQIYDD
ncbi:MAG: hypothetical protein AAF290_15875 [Pseudomonadota bacterium]